MRILAKKGCFILALALAAGPGFALPAFAAVDTNETVTVTGTRVLDELKADLDPTKNHYDGITGERIARDIDPLDRYSAFQEFARGLSGPLGRDYYWYGLHDDGHFSPTREFYEAGLLCRDFTEETEHRDVEVFPPSLDIDRREPIIMGTACREPDGWHFR